MNGYNCYIPILKYNPNPKNKFFTIFQEIYLLNDGDLQPKNFKIEGRPAIHPSPSISFPFGAFGYNREWRPYL